MDDALRKNLVELDHAHVWHPFTPMRQWRETEPIIIESAEGDELIDAHGKRYIDGVSSLWCNVHGHRVRAIDEAIREQLDKTAHTTMLGLANVPATRLAGKLVDITPDGLNHVFYSDSGATATEVAFKMAVGHAYHSGEPERNVFVALSGGYHGDTVGAMSIGYSDVFHRPYRTMVFETVFVDPPIVSTKHRWSMDDGEACAAANATALAALDEKLRGLGGRCAGIVVEPLVQGAAGMVMQPAGYLRGVADLCKKHGTLLIADEVATGFGRTGRMFASEHEGVEPDIMCLGKGLTGGYLPLAATLSTDAISQSFEGELHEMKTLYHGHTFTGNALGCAAALASIGLFESGELMNEVQRKAERLARALDPLRDHEKFAQVIDVRQRGLMVGIELGDKPGEGHDGGTSLGDFGETSNRYARRIGYEVTDAARADGVLIRPLGNVVILMPPLAITDAHLDKLARVVIETIEALGC